MRGRVRPASVVVLGLFLAAALTALLLLGLLAFASANTAFFDRYYSLLYTANIAVALVFLIIVSSLVWMIVRRLVQRKFGARLLAKLAVYFALVGVLPGSIIYLISLQFVSRSIESWFDVNVEAALESGLNLGRSLLDNALADLRDKSQHIARQLALADQENPTPSLSRLCRQFGVQYATIVSRTGKLLADVQMASNASSSLRPTLPAPFMLRAARCAHYYAAVESKADDQRLSDGVDLGLHGPLWLRVVSVIPIPVASGAHKSSANDARFLQLAQWVPATLAQQAQTIQYGWRNYQEKTLGRTGLRKMYIGTLTLALFLAIFIAMMLAFALGNQLARPLFLLAQGTKEVARGDYTPKREVRTNDELGFLTQSFNAMTRQLSEARAAVESNRIALEDSNAYLRNILSNLTAGVFVLDRQFKLTTANPGAENIFRQKFKAYLNLPLEQIPGLAEFSVKVRQAFHDPYAHEQADTSHWQQQFGISVGNESSHITLLVRGTCLMRLGAQKDAATHSEPAGYVLVFDDISDLISAQRSLAWKEVATRLAHEIKNPLTPIQLSTERLQMKLSDKLSAADAEMLKRGTNTIINQVSAMKRMVDDFREYARTPPAVMQNLQLNDLVAEVLTLYGVEEGKGALRLNLEPVPEIRGDPTQLRQVIHNLLQNAQDAVAEVEFPYILIETKTVEYGGVPGRGRAVRLSVLDNGPGFSSHFLSSAFEPYVTTKAKGTGLGLATVKKIVEEHAAHIDIRNRSKVGKEGAESVSGAQVSILFIQLAHANANDLNRR